MKALILAAGYATRLYPLTKEYPKPLLLVKNRPIIEYSIDKLSGLRNIDEIIIVTNSKFHPLFKEWRKTLKGIKKKIRLVDDLTKSKDDRRGAIGDMHFVIQSLRVKDDLIVIGGDNIFDAELERFFSFTKKHLLNPVIGVYDVKRKTSAAHYGVIKLDKDKRIIDFKEKPQNPDSTLVAMCLYYFPKKKVCLVKEYMDTRAGSYDAIGLYIDWLRKKEFVYGFVFKGSWYDIGQHKALRDAEQYFPD